MLPKLRSVGEGQIRLPECRSSKGAVQRAPSLDVWPGMAQRNIPCCRNGIADHSADANSTAETTSRPFRKNALGAGQRSVHLASDLGHGQRQIGHERALDLQLRVLGGTSRTAISVPSLHGAARALSTCQMLSQGVVLPGSVIALISLA